MTDPAGVFVVDELDIVPNWSIAGSNKALSIMQDGDVKRVIPVNTTQDYILYASSDYSVLNQNSYYEDFGTGIHLFVNARVTWISEEQKMILDLPSTAARNANAGSVIVSWEEDDQIFSTSMAKCYISEDRTSVTIESTIFVPNRIVHVDAAITYHLEVTPEAEAYR